MRNFLTTLFIIAFFMQTPLVTAINVSAYVDTSSIEEGDWPCKNHGCGCTTAIKCLSDCCCIKPKVIKKTCCHADNENLSMKSDLDIPQIDLLAQLACRGTKQSSDKESVIFRIKMPMLLTGN